jgi:hypothetical protein
MASPTSRFARTYRCTPSVGNADSSERRTPTAVRMEGAAPDSRAASARGPGERTRPRNTYPTGGAHRQDGLVCAGSDFPEQTTVFVPNFVPATGGLLNLDNFRRREWNPAITSSGIAKPARIYDLRSTFASNALAAGVTVFELAKIMGTSVRMIERHYGALLDGAGGIAGRLGAFEAAMEETREQASEDV